jgi:hypothetical protein
MTPHALDISRKVAPNPGVLPSLRGIDVADAVIPVFKEGGDRITRISFNDRYPLEAWVENVRSGGKDHLIMPALEGLEPEIIEKVLSQYRGNLAQKIIDHKTMYGVAMTDVAGHKDEGLIVNAAFHQALLTGILDHLPLRGEVPVALFENLNTRFKKTDDHETSIALMYGEISENGRFRYLAANSHAPMLYSAQYGKILHLSDSHASCFAIGVGLSTAPGSEEHDDNDFFPKPPYEVNEIEIAKGDILLLYSDGLADYRNGEYFAGGLEERLLQTKDNSARDICGAIKEDVSVGKRGDDISYVVIKKND